MLTKMIISVFDRVENIVGKGEIACTSNFSFSNNVFKGLFFPDPQKVSSSGNGSFMRSQLVLKILFFLVLSLALNLQALKFWCQTIKSLFFSCQLINLT